MKGIRLHHYLPVIGVIGLVGLWYAAVWLKVVDKVLLPSLSARPMGSAIASSNRSNCLRCRTCTPPSSQPARSATGSICFFCSSSGSSSTGRGSNTPVPGRPQHHNRTHAPQQSAAALQLGFSGRRYLITKFRMELRRGTAPPKRWCPGLVDCEPCRMQSAERQTIRDLPALGPARSSCGAFCLPG